MHLRKTCLTLLVLGMAGWHGSALAQVKASVTPIVIESKFITLEGQQRQAGIGDVVHQDHRTVGIERMTIVNDVVDECTSGWCYNFSAGDELVQVGYGPHLYCTLGKTAQRDTLFSDYMGYTCALRDRSKPNKVNLFGLKEFSKSLQVQKGGSPSGVRSQFNVEPLTAYPDWGAINPPNYLDGQFIIRFAGLDGEKVLFDLERIPEIEGSAEAQTVRVGFTPKDDKTIEFPLIGAQIDYQALADRNPRLSDPSVYAGVQMKVKSVSADTIDYQMFRTNRYLQVFPGGYWRVSNKGEGLVMQTRYR